MTADDCPRSAVTPAILAALPPRFRPEGRVTAGNSAPLSDGAAAVVVMSAQAARDRCITPLARILGTAVSALSPEIEGPAPVQATRTVLARAGMTLDDIDVIAGHEPFAAEVLGEAYGAAGARLTTTAIGTLQHTGGGTALVSIVAAGGQGMAMLLDRSPGT